MKKNIFFLFAALLTGGLLVSCSSDDTDDEKSYGGYEKKNYRLEVQANNGVGTRTLIYDANQNTITPSWTLGEEVGVHTPDDNGFGEITDIHLGKVVSNHTGNPTTLVGDFPQLSGNIQKGSQLIFTFPKSGEGGGTFNYYDGQDGTLETIASNFDYATATAEVEDFLQEGDKLYIQLKGGNHLNFINHTSITAFSFKDEEGNTLVPATFMISGQGLVKEYNVITDSYSYFPGINESLERLGDNIGNCIVVSGIKELNTIYVAMLNNNSQKTTYTLYLSARKEGTSELLSYKCRMSANLQPGKYYSTTVKMKKVKNWSDPI